MAKLYFYYSSMNAGKSTTLLQSDFNYRERGMDTMLWTAAVDTRYGSGRIASRIGLEAQAHLFEPGVDLHAAIARQDDATPLSCVLVDEAQFLTRDQVTLLKSDNVVGETDEDLGETADFDIDPETVEAITPTYLARYRKGGQFSEDPELIS